MSANSSPSCGQTQRSGGPTHANVRIGRAGPPLSSWSKPDVGSYPRREPRVEMQLAGFPQWVESAPRPLGHIADLARTRR